MTTTTATFPTLGTTAFVAVRDPAELALARRLAVRVLTDVDEVCSRFRDDSDLALVNRHPDTWVEVDPLLVAAVTVACAAARATGGLVTPLLGRQLIALGYDRDFSQLVERDDDVAETPPPGLTSWQQIETDPAGAVRIPAGTSLDLGATGKAWAADLIATAFEEELDAGALISLGGDLRIAAPDGSPWAVAISEHPGADPDTTITLDRGGLATSTTRVRRWSRGRVQRHHLLDPRTGRPAPEVWRTVTATGSTCAAANTASTAAVVLGFEAPTWLGAHGVTARLVAADGAVRMVGQWPMERSAA